MEGKLKEPIREIWKFEIEIADSFIVAMPMGSSVIHVATQVGVPCFWALVDPEAPSIPYEFYLRGTGHEVHVDLRYHGSFQLDDGRFVGHLFS